MQTDPDYDVPCSEACDAYKDAIAPPVFTLFDVISCDHCKKPMFPNVSTHDEDGMAWNCTTPGCGDFTGDEIEAEDLIACGCPPWIAERMNALSDACYDLIDRIDELEAALADLAEAGPEGRSRERKAYLGWRERAEQERRQRVQWTEVTLKAEANAQYWAESSKKFHDLADDWRMSFKGEEMRAEEAEAERDRLEKENREMFRQLLGAGETFNKMNAELRELQSNGKIRAEQAEAALAELRNAVQRLVDESSSVWSNKALRAAQTVDLLLARAEEGGG